MSLTTTGKREYYGFVRIEASAISGQLDLDDDAVERLKGRGAAFRQGLLALVRRHAAPRLIEDMAREVMGHNFFGSAECEKHFGVKLEEVPAIPFAADDLAAVKETHVLALVLPVSIEEIRAKHTNLFYSKRNAWFTNDLFATQAPDKAEWHLVRKTTVEGSVNKTWNEQQSLLSKFDETPTARVVIYTIIGHFLATGKRLFEMIYVRCSDLHASGRRVLVGSFDAAGLSIDYGRYDGLGYEVLGVASSKKPDCQ